jgi:hypothetical protein
VIEITPLFQGFLQLARKHCHFGSLFFMSHFSLA